MRYRGIQLMSLVVATGLALFLIPGCLLGDNFKKFGDPAGPSKNQDSYSSPDSKTDTNSNPECSTDLDCEGDKRCVEQTQQCRDPADDNHDTEDLECSEASQSCRDNYTCLIETEIRRKMEACDDLWDDKTEIFGCSMEGQSCEDSYKCIDENFLEECEKSGEQHENKPECEPECSSSERCQQGIDGKWKCIEKAPNQDGACNHDSGSSTHERVRARGSECTRDCLEKTDAVEECVKRCLGEPFIDDGDIGEDCLGCYTEYLECGLDECRTECEASDDVDSCQSCINSTDCNSDFKDCSGIAYRL